MDKESDRELLFSITKKDLKIDAFYSGGPGGQNQNKRKTGCRVTHIDSGAVGEARDSRSFDQNRRNAFVRMTETKKFKDWIRIKATRYADIQIEPEDIIEIFRTYNFKRNDVTGSKLSPKKFLEGER